MGASAGANAATSTPRKSALDVDDQPPAYSSPISNAATPRTSTAPATGPVSRPESRPENARNLGDAIDAAGSPSGHDKSAASGVMGAAAGAASGAAAAVANAVPTSREQLEERLNDANATIMRLKEQVQDQPGLRQRRGDAGTDTRDANVNQPALAMQQAPNGVPVPITAALCLLSFLLAYFFF